MNSCTDNRSIKLNENDKKVLSEHALDMSRLLVQNTIETTKKIDPYGTISSFKSI